MASTISKKLVINGSRNYVLRYEIVLDGSGTGEAASLVNVTTGDMGTDNKVVKIVSNMPVNATLLFDATADVPFFTIAANTFTKISFRDIGGLVNNAGAGKTGDILLTTPTTAGAANMSGFIELWVQKK